jgi:hypothetical protein
MENEKLNREQRRRQKFGKAGKVHQHGQLAPWPESEPNAALRNPTADEAAEAAAAAEDVARKKGAGTAGTDGIVNDQGSRPTDSEKG